MRRYNLRLFVVTLNAAMEYRSCIINALSKITLQPVSKSNGARAIVILVPVRATVREMPNLVIRPETPARIIFLAVGTSPCRRSVGEPPRHPSF